jgi:hypothetical protein
MYLFIKSGAKVMKYAVSQIAVFGYKVIDSGYKSVVNTDYRSWIVKSKP